MFALDSTAGWAAQAGLTGITLIPLGMFWVLDMRRHIEYRSQPVRFARIFLRITLPILMIGVVLAIVGPAILAVIQANPRRVQNTRDARAAVFTAVAATFMLTASGIFTTVAVYFSALGILYLVLAKQKWWRLRRIDALTSASILFIITIAWFVRNLVGAVRFEYEESLLLWLLDIVDIAISLLAAGIVGLAIYVTTKLKERSHLGVGNISGLLLAASVLWLPRCTFVLVVHIKSTVPDWTYTEQQIQKVLYPILDLWVSTIVLGLVTSIVWFPVWSDPAAIPDTRTEQQEQQQQPLQIVYVPQPIYVPLPPDGGQYSTPNQQYPHPYPHPHPQPYPGRPIFYVQEPFPTEVSAASMLGKGVYEANTVRSPEAGGLQSNSRDQR